MGACAISNGHLSEVHETWDHKGQPGDKRHDRDPDQQHEQVRHVGPCGRLDIDLAQPTGDEETDPEGRKE